MPTNSNGVGPITGEMRQLPHTLAVNSNNVTLHDPGKSGAGVLLKTGEDLR